MTSSATPISYQQACREHRWEVPERYNIAADVCDRHPREKLAMIHEDFHGNVREVIWGSYRTLSNRFANVLAAHGVAAGDRVAMLLPPTAGDRCGVLRDLEARRDPAVDVRAVRRRGHPSPRDRLAGQGARDQRRERRPDRALAGGAGADPRRRAAGRARPSSSASTRSPRIPRSSTTRAARRGWRRGSCTPTATSSRTRSSSTATTSATASGSTGWASGRGRPGSVR
jgi:hypothetical protein